MSSKSVAHVLAPFKFMLIIMNIMLVISMLHMREEFIFARLRMDFGKSSSNYKDADNELIVGLVLMLATLIIQEFIVLIGVNLFLDEANMLL